MLGIIFGIHVEYKKAIVMIVKIHQSFTHYRTILGCVKSYDERIYYYSKSMGVSTYKPTKEMSEELKRALPDVNELRKILENETI